MVASSNPINRSRTLSASSYINSKRWLLLLVALACLHDSPIHGFTIIMDPKMVSPEKHGLTRKDTTKLHAAAAVEADDMDRLKARAMAVLEKSKAKLAAIEGQEEEESQTATATATVATKEAPPSAQVAIPFFASAIPVKSASASGKKRDQVIKSRNDDGLITTDGEKMASMSEKEEWESRSLFEVFENEMKEDATSNRLAERDVAASVYNLRKQLQQEDYRRIFDKRNRFIGEDN